MKIIVIGAGAWGTALAVSAARNPAGHHVVLWARDGAQAEAMDDTRENARYLPGIPLPRELNVRGGDVETLMQAVPQADLIIVATPVAGLRPTLELLREVRVPVGWLCKGFEPAQNPQAPNPFGLMPHEIQAQVAPALQAGALSGPSFAQEVARGQPTALVAASRRPRPDSAVD